MRNRKLIQTGILKAIVSSPLEKANKLLILLHGVGANEKGLLEAGELLAPDSLVVSLRAPLMMGQDSFAWFHVQFTPDGPKHNWQEAEESLGILEKEILGLSKTYDIPLSNIDVMGFSQGSIMTMGLLLRSNLKLGRYLCFSGRTLPEFAQFAYEHPDVVSGKKVFLTHGLYDDKLPVVHGRKSKEILEEVRANFHYYEFPGGHQISLELLKEALRWSQNGSWTEV